MNFRFWLAAAIPAIARNVRYLAPRGRCSGDDERQLRVASRRWVATDGFHRLNGGKWPPSDIWCTRKLTFECLLPEQIQPFGQAIDELGL